MFSFQTSCRKAISGRSSNNLLTFDRLLIDLRFHVRILKVSSFALDSYSNSISFSFMISFLQLILRIKNIKLNQMNKKRVTLLQFFRHVALSKKHCHPIARQYMQPFLIKHLEFLVFRI